MKKDNIKRQQQASLKANSLWQQAVAVVNHPYLVSKQIKPHDVKCCQQFNGQSGNWLLIPIMTIDGKILSLQGILANGNKRFFKHAPTDGACILGHLTSTTNIAYICEGFATGATIYEIMNHPVVCALSCYNLEKIVPRYQQAYPDIDWIMVADNDHGLQHNVGLSKAEKLSRNYQISYVYPLFHGQDQRSHSDFNDYYRCYGQEKTKEALNDSKQAIPDDVNLAIQAIDIHSLDANGKQKRRSERDILESIGRCCQFIINRIDGAVYAVIWESGVRKVFALDSEDFSDWLIIKYLGLTKEGANRRSLDNALCTLRAYAKYHPKKALVCLRFGHVDDTCYLDLCNDRWEVLAISQAGCHVIKNPPIYFERTVSMQPLTIDLEAKPDDFLLLFKIINVPKEQQTLILCWLLAVLKGHSPYAVLNIYGSADSGKTTLTKAMRCLLDPVSSSTRAFPKEQRHLISMLKNNAVLAFDNTGMVSPELSDQLARLTFGKDAGMSQRQLYTNDREKIYNRQVPVVINSINDSIIRP